MLAARDTTKPVRKSVTSSAKVLPLAAGPCASATGLEPGVRSAMVAAGVARTVTTLVPDVAESTRTCAAVAGPTASAPAAGPGEVQTSDPRAMPHGNHRPPPIMAPPV